MCVFGYATIQLYMHEYMCKSIDKLMYLAAMTIIIHKAQISFQRTVTSTLI